MYSMHNKHTMQTYWAGHSSPSARSITRGTAAQIFSKIIKVSLNIVKSFQIDKTLTLLTAFVNGVFVWLINILKVWRKIHKITMKLQNKECVRTSKNKD
jgi:fumarate reductase subunit D